MGLKELGRNLKISQRPLEMIYVIDVSGSMEENGKIQQVNYAMHVLESALRDEAKKNPTAQVNVRVITFGDEQAKWHMGSKNAKTPVESFRYEDINHVEGGTPYGMAFNLLRQALDENNMPNRSLPPVIVLLSDGWPTDNYEDNLNKLLAMPWGKKAVKVAIAIGAKADKDVLAQFTTDPSLVVEVRNATNLTNAIRWTSTLVTHASQHADAKKPIAVPTALSVLPDEGDY